MTDDAHGTFAPYRAAGSATDNALGATIRDAIRPATGGVVYRATNRTTGYAIAMAIHDAVVAAMRKP